MKQLLVLIALAVSPLAAQQTDLQSEAVRAFQSGDYASARTLFESLLSQDPRNAAAKNYLRIIAQREKGGAELEGHLRKIIIPSAIFQNATTREAVAFVSQKVAELTGGKQALNVVWLVPEDRDTSRVSLSLQNVPASEVLRYIAESAGLEIAYSEHAATIRPRDSAPRAGPMMRSP